MPDTVGQLGEFEIIERMAARYSATWVATQDEIGAVASESGIGDDCAVVRFGDTPVLLASDMLVEGRHFQRTYVEPSALGFKALAVNVSDVAAMGGRPAHALVSLSLPAELEVHVVDGIVDGLAEAAETFGVAIVGGDTTSGDAIVIDVAVTGLLPAGRAVARAGACPGDVLCVTGALGGSHAGLRVLLAHGVGVPVDVRDAEVLVHRHQRPVPRVEGGVAAAESGVTAMIDVSDGLLADVGHIAKRSGVSVDVTSERVPVEDGVAEVARAFGFDALASALSGGEDYELAMTVPPERLDAVRTAVEAFEVPLSVIGAVGEGSGVTVDGATPQVSSAGWDHFRASEQR